MGADNLIGRLEKVRRTGPGKWQALCPAHQDKNPSLSIRQTDDQRVLLHCFAGCSVESILDAVELTFDHLFPPRPPRADGYRPERRPFLPFDVFDIARFEVGVVFLIACDMHKLRVISEKDYERLLMACGRLERIAEVAYGHSS